MEGKKRTICYSRIVKSTILFPFKKPPKRNWFLHILPFGLKCIYIYTHIHTSIGIITWSNHAHGQHDTSRAVQASVAAYSIWASTLVGETSIFGPCLKSGWNDAVIVEIILYVEILKISCLLIYSLMNIYFSGLFMYQFTYFNYWY